MQEKQLVKLTSSHVKAALRLRYQAPEYAVLEEVRNATGKLKKYKGKQPRYADMIAMGLWPSNGLEITGFEVKISRADWLNEISDEKKAVAVSQFCDRWYLVTSSEKIVKEGELPAHWGWMVISLDMKVKIIKEAPLLQAKPITREFLASLMRNAVNSNPDYVEVQSKIMEKTVSTMSITTKSARKTIRRKVSSIAAISKKSKIRSDMDFLIGKLN